MKQVLVSRTTDSIINICFAKARLWPLSLIYHTSIDLRKHGVNEAAELMDFVKEGLLLQVCLFEHQDLIGLADVVLSLVECGHHILQHDLELLSEDFWVLTQFDLLEGIIGSMKASLANPSLPLGLNVLVAFGFSQFDGKLFPL